MERLKTLGGTGFTLLELLVVLAILGTLAMLLTPALAAALRYADQVACTSNLRQLGMATRHYLDAHGGRFFPLQEQRPDGTLWYFGFESGESRSRGEGHRTLDRTRSRLHPYLGGADEIAACPAVPFGGPYKPKFEGDSWTYGINYALSGHHTSANYRSLRPRDLTRTVLFADAAQVNTFQAPASPANPMVEDWYYVQPGARQVQFRHEGKANVLFADWHVAAMAPAEGSFDGRMPEAKIGHLDPDKVTFAPYQPR